MAKKIYLNQKQMDKEQRSLFRLGMRISRRLSKLRRTIENLSQEKRSTLQPLILHLEVNQYDGARLGNAVCYFTRNTTPSFNVVMSQVKTRIPKKYRTILENKYNQLKKDAEPVLIFRDNGAKK